MSYADMILPEFEQEMANTRKVLECIPDDKLDWKALEKTHTIGWNACHLAEMPGWVVGTLTEDSWDMAPEGEEPYQTPSIGSVKEILELFDKNVAAAKEAFKNAKDEKMGDPWSLKAGAQVLITMPRAAVIRTFVLNHTIHHRAHLLVYLRLNNIPVPGMYGPSGDEEAV